MYVIATNHEQNILNNSVHARCLSDNELTAMVWKILKKNCIEILIRRKPTGEIVPDTLQRALKTS